MHPKLTDTGPIEAEFVARHGRRIAQDGGFLICTGGKHRCEDCRCGLPSDWRAQDAAALARKGKSAGDSKDAKLARQKQEIARLTAENDKLRREKGEVLFELNKARAALRLREGD